LGVDGKETSEEVLLDPAFLELVFFSFPLVFLRRGGVSFPEDTCSTEAKRGVENSDGAIAAV
jgi:hypothetical protein